MRLIFSFIYFNTNMFKNITYLNKSILLSQYFQEDGMDVKRFLILQYVLIVLKIIG